MALVRRLLADVITPNRGVFLSFGLLGTLWAASGGFANAIEALNLAYDVQETRPFWKTRLLRPLEEIRSAIADAVRRAPGVLPDPAPEVFLADLTPDLVKLRVLWSTREARQQHMLVSYDQVLTAITNVLDRLQSQSQRAA